MAVALGAMAAGAAVTGISPMATEPEAAAQLTDSGASLLVTLPEEVLASAGQAPEVASDQGAVALLPYSSGTTGLPKGVMVTHLNVVAAVHQIAGALKLTPRDTLIAIAPFAHVMGFVVNAAGALAAGTTLVTMPRFDLDAFVDLVERHRATVLIVPPPVMNALARHPAVAARDLSSVELVVSGGAPLGAEVQRAVAERLGVTTRQGWGLTETAATATAPDRERAVTPGSVGRAMPSTELRVVDPDSGADLGAGGRGELWVRGPQVMVGYLCRPDATAAMIDADGWLRTGDLGHINADGWLRTGDLGHINADGEVFIVDRLKELIKVSAHQVAPAELEALLATHPAVADVAVVPRADPDHGEIPVAVVVAGAAIDGTELMEWVAERVAPYKRIRDVRFADALPRTPAGKLLRRLIAAPEPSQAAR
jgi:acyl-CoA synthetase (AMP-forming)/AMP-acid ligase II